MGTVIKAGSGGKTLRGLGMLALKDHVAEAHSIVADARAQAVRWVRAAKDDVARARKDAADRGYDEGYAKGKAAGARDGHAQAFEEASQRFSREQDSLLSALQEAASTFGTRKDELLTQARQDVLELAVAIAERVTKHVGVVDRGVVTSVAEEALRHIDASTDIAIRVSPVDIETMNRYATKLAERLARQTHTTVVEDARIAPGGCVIQSSQTRVDATLDGQLEQMVELLLGKRRQSKAEGQELQDGDVA